MENDLLSCKLIMSTVLSLSLSFALPFIFGELSELSRPQTTKKNKNKDIPALCDILPLRYGVTEKQFCNTVLCNKCHDATL